MTRNSEKTQNINHTVITSSVPKPFLSSKYSHKTLNKSYLTRQHLSE
jgi:hypothetical protein